MFRELDLTNLPAGKSYEETYNRWLKLFQRIAEGKVSSVRGAPKCWVPLILYLGCKVKSFRKVFYCDAWLRNPSKDFAKAAAIGRQRELVEFYCALRPELVDALWKSDVEWKTKNRLHTAQKDFVVTTNNSFYRPELLAFIKKVHRYKTKKKKCILVPCSADKPYPSELHKIIKKIAGEDWLIIVVSGAIGLAPEELFKDMPNYDSGLPYFWRIRDEVQKFFKRNKFEKIVVYSDFNSAAIKAGLDVLKQNATYVFGTRIREYQNLKSQKNLKKLATALKS